MLLHMFWLISGFCHAWAPAPSLQTLPLSLHFRRTSDREPNNLKNQQPEYVRGPPGVGADRGMDVVDDGSIYMLGGGSEVDA
jgi:hypothetical protein